MFSRTYNFVATLAVGALAGALSCSTQPLPQAADEDPPVAFRLENASAGAVTLTVEMLDRNGAAIETAAAPQGVDIPVVTITPDGVNYATLNPIGAAAAAAAGNITDLTATGLDLAPSADVRVPAFAISEGFLLCGAIARVTATLEDGDETPVPLFGAGTGTPGFDSGSIGETGQRYLVEGVHYTCGEAVVIRVGDAAAAVGDDVRGELAVVAGDEPSPFDPIEAPDDDDVDDTPTTVAIQVENLGSVIGTVRLIVATAAGNEQNFTVTVPPGAMSTGAFTCGTQFTVSASYPDPETPEDQETERLVILTGDGTGSPGFDSNSVSRQGDRILEVGAHVACGDTIRITIRDDVEPVGFSGAGAFSGTVEVFSAGE